MTGLVPRRDVTRELGLNLRILKETEVKTSNCLAAATLSILAAACAHAETYDGVHPPTTVNSRTDVNAQAVTAAHSANPYADGYSAGVAPAMAASADPAAVLAEAVAAAHRPNQTTPREAFVNSVVPSQYSAAPSAPRQAALNPQLPQ